MSSLPSDGWRSQVSCTVPRVVITGLGAITPLGHSVAEMFANVVAGKSGVDRIRTFDARTFPTTFAAEVKDFELSKWISNARR